MSRSKRHKKSRAGLVLVIFLLIVIIAIVVGYSVYKSLLNYNDVCDSTNTEYVSFTISPGTSGNAVVEDLERDGIIKDANKLKLHLKLTKQAASFQAGDFKLSPSMSTDEIIEALQNAKRETISFTIPEGYSIKDIAEKLCTDGFISDVSEFYSACEDEYDYWFIPEPYSADPTGAISAKANRLEGFLAPNTYEVFVNPSAHDIINKMLSGFDKMYSDDIQNATKKSGYTAFEIVTMASMIEAETKADFERAMVASVIFNRLDIGMKLQLDACVQYCLGQHTGRVLYKDLEIDSPYNTYKVEGLPIGPICSPRLASIEAVLNPEETDYIYYVLKPDNSGTHNFAATSAEFEKYNAEYKNSL